MIFLFNWVILRFHITLPETNSSHLKIGLPNRKVVFQPSIFRGYVISFREGNFEGCTGRYHHICQELMISGSTFCDLKLPLFWNLFFHNRKTNPLATSVKTPRKINKWIPLNMMGLLNFVPSLLQIWRHFGYLFFSLRGMFLHLE